MAQNDFSEDDKLRCLLWCDRHCCLCGKAAGSNIEIAHIIPKKRGGPPELNQIDNAIPLCFECHSEIGKYNREHPKGNKYRVRELKTRRDQVYEQYTRHLVPPISYVITQYIGLTSGIRVLPDVGFTLRHTGNSLSAKILVALEIFLNNNSLGMAETENGLYSGRKYWNLNPGEGVNGHFPIPNEAVTGTERLEIRVNIKILDQYEREHYLLPVGYVYMRDVNSWFLEPGETLYRDEHRYQFQDWGQFGIH